MIYFVADADIDVETITIAASAAPRSSVPVASSVAPTATAGVPPSGDAVADAAAAADDLELANLMSADNEGASDAVPRSMKCLDCGGSPSESPHHCCSAFGMVMS